MMTVTNTSNSSYQPQALELTLLFFSLLALVFVDLFQLDFVVADWIYKHTAWTLKKSFVFETLLHKTARVMLIVLYLAVVVAYIKKLKLKQFDQARHLLVLFVTIGSSVLWVTLLKRFLDVDCPWDLLRYGGEVPFQSIFNYSNGSESAHCFPASHASVGYSWVAVYFYFLVTANHNASKAFKSSILLGMTFGLAQQMRGAHFISHDLWSLVICLSNAMLIYWLVYQPEKRRSSCLMSKN